MRYPISDPRAVVGRFAAAWDADDFAAVERANMAMTRAGAAGVGS